MYFYFSSSFPSAIKFNGIYYGLIQDTVKVCNFDDGFTPFIEICPLDNSGAQLNFLPDNEFLSAPPDGVSVTDLRGGYLLQFSKRCKFNDFAVICQEKFTDALATVYSENGVKISIETKTDFFVETINLDILSAKIKKFHLNGGNFLSVLLGENSGWLLVYSIDGKIRKVFSREIDGFCLDNGFSTIEVFKDMAKHKIETEWQFDGENLTVKSKNITCTPSFNKDDLPISLIPFAFLEDFLVGANITDYLAEKLKQNADKLKAYLGDYIGVMPPPIFRKIDQVGLIYPDGKNKYKVDYCTFEFKDKNISNIKKLDD